MYDKEIEKDVSASKLKCEPSSASALPDMVNSKAQVEAHEI